MKSIFTWIIVVLIVASIAGLAPLYAMRSESRQNAAAMTGGNPEHGRTVIAYYGCGSCHTIPGIRGANAVVGPSLAKIGTRTFIAGVLTNNPDELERWIIDPPSVDPKTAMPNVRVSPSDARDIAAYLYTLR